VDTHTRVHPTADKTVSPKGMNASRVPFRAGDQLRIAFGALVLAVPLALLGTVILVMRSAITLVWAVPVYGLATAALTILFTLISYFLGRSSAGTD